VKKVTHLIVIGCAVIASIMIYLFKSGISVRSQTLIRPSPIEGDMAKVSQAVFLRLFPEFEDRDVFVIGADKPSPGVSEFIAKLELEAEDHYKKKVQVFDDDHLLSSQNEFSSCSKTCWVMTETQSTSDIAPMPSVMQLAGLNEKNRFTLSIFEFDTYDPAVIPKCEKEKRLTLECLKNLAIKEMQHQMRDHSQKYFFLKQYLDRDYFLFIQK